MAKIITLEDMNKDLFYKLPKAFFHNPKYMFMKNETKMAYGLLRDLLSLSIKNNWINSNNEPFVRLSREKLMVRLQIKGSQKMAQIMKELIENDLIVEKRLGQGNTNIIYVCIPDELNTVIYDESDLLAAITQDELDSIGVKSQTFENQNSAETIANTKTFENQKSKTFVIKSLKRIISKNKTKQNQSVIETNLSDTKKIETNLSDTNDCHEDNDNVKRIKEEWTLYHNHDIPEPTFRLLCALLNQYDIEMVSLLIDLSTNSTKNSLMYIKGIVRKWKSEGVNTIDDYFDHEQNRESI